MARGSMVSRCRLGRPMGNHQKIFNPSVPDNILRDPVQSRNVGSLLKAAKRQNGDRWFLPTGPAFAIVLVIRRSVARECAHRRARFFTVVTEVVHRLPSLPPIARARQRKARFHQAVQNAASGPLCLRRLQRCRLLQIASQRLMHIRKAMRASVRGIVPG